jgi:hypothetical protein
MSLRSKPAKRLVPEELLLLPDARGSARKPASLQERKQETNRVRQSSHSALHSFVEEVSPVSTSD